MCLCQEILRRLAGKLRCYGSLHGLISFRLRAKNFENFLPWSFGGTRADPRKGDNAFSFVCFGITREGAVVSRLLQTVAPDEGPPLQQSAGPPELVHWQTHLFLGRRRLLITPSA